MHTSVPSESNLKTMKSASGKRYPGENTAPLKKTSRPQQCSEAWGGVEKNKCAQGTLRCGPNLDLGELEVRR